MPLTAEKLKALDAVIEKNHEMIEVARTTPARPDANHLFGGFSGRWQETPYPEQQLKRLSVYGPEHVDFLTRTKGAGTRYSGIGPYLCKMAGMAAASINHTDTLQKLREQGLWDSGGYATENFEKEFKVKHAAASQVTKGYSGREVRKTALAEGSGQTGGYTVPPQFMNELLTIGAEDGFIEQRAKVVPMNTRTVQWPMLDITTAQAAGTTPYFGGILAAWQPEAASINETEPAFRQSEWVAWDLVLYTVTSNQLLADNGIGLDALLTQLFGQAVTWYKEFAYLQGRGAGNSMPLGVLNAPATIQVTRAQGSHVTLKDLATMMSKLQIRSWDSATWMIHQSVLPDLVQLNDISAIAPGTAGNHLMWVTPYGNTSVGPAAMKLPTALLNGLPMFVTEKLPQLGTLGCIALVDWSRYVIGMRLDIQIDVSPHYLFRNNQLAWRVIARLDAKPWLNSFITDQSGFTVSPFVTLTQ